MTQDAVTVRAPAKINLHLGVGRPRPDGLHPLATVYQAVGLYDDVSVTDAATWSVALAEPVAGVPLDDDNIAIRAGRALAEHHGIDRAAAITIAKGIPVMGGMAGGSADAAATLLALDRLWDLQTPDDDLLRIAGTLGSDVPFALVGGTALGTGHGQLVTPVDDASSVWWVVVLSDEGLSTPAVYRHFDELSPDAPAEPPVPDALIEALAGGYADEIGDLLANDLWPAARDLRPDLVDVEVALRSLSPDGVLLSGSGPTLLMLHEGVEEARAAAADLTERGYRCTLAPGPVAGAHVVTYA
ncbi:4-(cytidine 5'-diphospho)-2-C-methyl-D-erythritol kinase [Pimelobacter simplex]|uniref:4-diphosphocytidyl-2-C-methyl-D-erythritol kinase n=1 Tax=Nocardioides simplex TaxID=2045 RepID=A0A0A1DLT9_NOCSI|nr:4-(cytidine 5'-diphospho)-2-C-methyl-D-erythritol kinase [Pimelobacter simplex]AIY16360.1 4-diphosphocytidyl-2-C-methyl-D-erythritol kinase [Pimelobacter simplex]MCG8152983.1 4-(cytidine 5'-diphospho)-2-C-methyl-D-erythritol kinase [Pimelobacter simplex]GEB11950.1 4-diphosphocytidyl-2-C-methyl-D-erythritol kinase [Pimelobacter simplex]SFN03674.1 4-diphosphocytidyl-2-C-methyl-D-erythritol kinase [Pimelobacter simplex]